MEGGWKEGGRGVGGWGMEGYTQRRTEREREREREKQKKNAGELYPNRPLRNEVKQKRSETRTYAKITFSRLFECFFFIINLFIRGGRGWQGVAGGGRGVGRGRECLSFPLSGALLLSSWLYYSL